MNANLQQFPQREEIDLADLFRGLWQQRLSIALAALIATLGAAGYAFLATPHYKTETFLRPVEQSRLDQLNETGLYSLTPQEALERVAAGLSSYERRLRFFKENRGLFEGIDPVNGSEEQAFAAFNEKAFAILRPDPKKAGSSPYVGLALTYPEGVEGVTIVNAFVHYVLESERQEIADDLQSLIANRLAGLEMKIDAARANYGAIKQSQIAMLLERDALERAQLKDELSALREQLVIQRQHRIAQLDEAMAIAESLGIRSPTSPSAIASAAQGGSVIRTEITSQELPLYFLGTDALAAEREALAARSSDDFADQRVAEIQTQLMLLERNREVEILRQRSGEEEDLYLANLAEWKEEAARLAGIKLDIDRLKLVKVDQLALQPRAPEKPKKALAIGLGLISGLMIGVFVALVRMLAAAPAKPPAAKEVN